MVNKELNLKKDCVVCHYKINFKADRYVRLTDFDGKKQTGECFYHLNCWKEKFNIQRENAMGYIKEMMNKISGVINEKEFIVQ